MESRRGGWLGIQPGLPLRWDNDGTFIPHAEFTQIENAYLQTPEWREFRNRALIHFRFRCAVCAFRYKDRGDHLEVDHKWYVKNGQLIFGHETMPDVRLLCSRHHLQGTHT